MPIHNASDYGYSIEGQLPAPTNKVTISIVRKTLSDGSEVFDVDFCGWPLECVTEKDAWTAAESMALTINKFTNMSAVIVG